MRTVIAVAALLASAGAGAGVAAVAVHESTGSTSTTVVRRPVTVNAAPAASTTPAGALSVSQIYQKSIDGVVEVLSTGGGGQSFFGGQQTESAQGTGFEVDSLGDIVTNYHVVAGADSVRVRLNDGHTYGGIVIGKGNPNRDVAVIRIRAPQSELHPLAFADSSAVTVGDSVVAIGDPYGLRNTVTAGIVSALNRTIVSPDNHPITGVIQTDAAINSGNSGGPLLNTEGQVIGVNSQIESGSQGTGGGSSGNIGIGFSIPSNMVASTARTLIENGKSTPYVGVELVTVSPALAKATGMTAGVEVVSVTKGAPADKAGLQGSSGTQTVDGTPFSTGGDVITTIDGTAVHSANQLIALIQKNKPGDHISLTISRDGSTRTVTVTLGNN
jgi:putative serine protease PepD